jgi:hypothetical protein
MTSKPMAIYYEHPDWFRPLFKELDARGINYVKLDASYHSYDPAAATTDFSLFFNRMSVLTEQDQADNVRVLREAKMATHRIFDPATKQLIEVPDHKTRLAAVTLELAYTEGRPVERQVQLSGDFEDLQSLLDAMKHSPAAQESLRRSDYSLQSGQNAVTEIPALEESD